MAKIHDILNFYFLPSALLESSQSIIPITLKNIVQNRVESLNNLSEQLGASAYKMNTNYLIPQVFKKFKKAFRDDNIEFELRELKTLVYSFTFACDNLPPILNDVNEIRFAIKALENKWRDSFLIGLIDCVLRNWKSKNLNSLQFLQQFITQKLKDYDGNRNSLLGFKTNRRYFNLNNGDLILGDTIAKLNVPLQEVIAFLKVPDSWFQYPYFSNVITTYYVRRKEHVEEELEYLENILLRHNKSETTKRILSKTIIHVNNKYPYLQDKIKSIALQLVGDPSHATAWLPQTDSDDNIKREILTAKNILNEWITKQFIDIFFKTCINEPRRKKFWMQYSSKISSFKIVGSVHTKALLKRNEKISEILDSRFQLVSSKKITSAFILYIDNYMLIEFSDEGYAFYAYKLNSLFTPNINNRLTSVDDLRNSTLPRLVSRTGTRITEIHGEGRLSHNDGELLWEEVFHYWLKNIAKIYA